MFANNVEIKNIEEEYFSNVNYNSSRLFGGTLGSKSGGITAICISANGRIIAYALNNGTILVYDTKTFELVRIFAN